nr:hypothetical protein [Tanacetum cinerariifolium]
MCMISVQSKGIISNSYEKNPQTQTMVVVIWIEKAPQGLSRTYYSTKQVNSIHQLLAYYLTTGTEGLEASRALFKKRQKPKSENLPTETKVTPPKPTKGYEKSHSVSSSIVPDSQDLKRNIQLDSMGFPSTLNEGTHNLQHLLESTATHLKDSEGNIQPLNRDLTSMTFDEGTAKTTPRPKGPIGDKDLEGNKPLADMELIHPILADPLESKEDILGGGKEMDEEPQAASIGETHHQYPPPQADKPQSSHAPSTEASDTDSSYDDRSLRITGKSMQRPRLIMMISKHPLMNTMMKTLFIEIRLTREEQESILCFYTTYSVLLAWHQPRKIRNKDLQTGLEYFNEDYDEEQEMEPRLEPNRKTTPPIQLRSLVVHRQRERIIGLKKLQTGKEAREEEMSKNSQKAGSILNYEDLKAKFRSHFSQKKKFTKTHMVVHNIKQIERESTTDFVTRYTDDTLEILDLHEEQCIFGFVHCLRTGSLVEHLSTYLPSTYKGLMEKTYTWIEAREVATNEATNKRRENFRRLESSSCWLLWGKVMVLSHATNRNHSVHHPRSYKIPYAPRNWHRPFLIQPKGTGRREEQQKKAKDIFICIDAKERIVLNLKKCSFGVEEEIFSGHLIKKQGIKANHLKVKAISDLQPPKSVIEIKNLNRKMAALNHFLSKGAYKTLPFMRTLKSYTSGKMVQWKTEADEAFQRAKDLSKALPMETQKIFLSSLHSGSKRQTNKTVKGRILAEYLAKAPSKEEEGVKDEEAKRKEPKLKSTWTLFIDRASSSNGSGAGLILASP